MVSAFFRMAGLSSANLFSLLALSSIVAISCLICLIIFSTLPHILEPFCFKLVSRKRTWRFDDDMERKVCPDLEALFKTLPDLLDRVERKSGSNLCPEHDHVHEASSF